MSHGKVLIQLNFFLECFFQLGLFSPAVCPTGYRYAGDDAIIPKNNETIDPRHQQMERGGYYVEEVDRTDMYSCYKVGNFYKFTA